MKSVLCCELKNNKNIRAKASKKRINSSSDSFSNTLYSNYFLSGDSNWDEEIHPDDRREINKLDQIVTNSIKTNKYQRNDAIKNEPNLIIALIYPEGLKTLYS